MFVGSNDSIVLESRQCLTDEIVIRIFVGTDDHDPSIEELSIEIAFTIRSSFRNFVSSNGTEVFVALIKYLVCVLVHKESVGIHVGNLVKVEEIPKVKTREDVLEPLSFEHEWWHDPRHFQDTRPEFFKATSGIIVDKRKDERNVVVLGMFLDRQDLRRGKLGVIEVAIGQDRNPSSLAAVDIVFALARGEEEGTHGAEPLLERRRLGCVVGVPEEAGFGSIKKGRDESSCEHHGSSKRNPHFSYQVSN